MSLISVIIGGFRAITSRAIVSAFVKSLVALMLFVICSTTCAVPSLDSCSNKMTSHILPQFPCRIGCFGSGNSNGCNG